MSKPPPKPARPCPVCGKPMQPGQRFCSDRCQRVDLGRWLSGDYAVPAEEEEPPGDESEA